jgi:SAM-dependent methyltransferase
MGASFGDGDGGADAGSDAGSLADLLANRRHWDAQAADYVAAAERGWSVDIPHWGVWRIPDDDPAVRVLPPVDGLRVVELGCGTAYVSAWLARRGAVPVGIDNSPAQLATARRMQAEHSLPFPLVWGDASRLPFASDSFDLAISEYGAALWCDPYRWIPEAARVLRPGGLLVFQSTSAWAVCCSAPNDVDGVVGETLHQPYFGMHRVVWGPEEGVEFHLGHGDWLRLLRGCGFEVLDLVELRPGPDATSRHPWLTLEWSRQWPAEEIWVARLR